MKIMHKYSVNIKCVKNQTSLSLSNLSEFINQMHIYYTMKTSIMEFFLQKMVKGFYVLTVFAISSLTDVYRSPRYTSDVYCNCVKCSMMRAFI